MIKNIVQIEMQHLKNETPKAYEWVHDSYLKGITGVNLDCIIWIVWYTALKNEIGVAESWKVFWSCC